MASGSSKIFNGVMVASVDIMSSIRRSSQAPRCDIHTWNVWIPDCWLMSASACRASSRRPARPRPMTRMPWSPVGMRSRGSNDDEPVDVALHHQRLLKAGHDVRVEPPRLGMRGDGLLEQARIAAGVHEAREELGVVAVARGLVQQPDDGVAAPARSRPRGSRRTCARPRALD